MKRVMNHSWCATLHSAVKEWYILRCVFVQPVSPLKSNLYLCNLFYFNWFPKFGQSGNKHVFILTDIHKQLFTFSFKIQNWCFRPQRVNLALSRTSVFGYSLPTPEENMWLYRKWSTVLSSQLITALSALLYKGDFKNTALPTSSLTNVKLYFCFSTIKDPQSLYKGFEREKLKSGPRQDCILWGWQLSFAFTCHLPLFSLSLVHLKTKMISLRH